MTGIDELVEFVRAGLDKDQRDAEKHACALDCLAHTSEDWHRVRHERGRGSTMNALRSVGLDMLGAKWPGMPEGAVHGIHYVGMRGTAMDPARVLAEVVAKRRLLDEVLDWDHYEADDPWYSCPSHPEYAKVTKQPAPCTCGRDERVLQVLQTLAAPYQETT